MEKRRLYMDYAATTPVKPEVLEAMMPYYTTYFGNASSFHQFGREAKEGLDKGRAQVASLINADPREVYFTNGGSESDNWALEGTAFARRNKGNHIITSKIEHHAILHTCEYLEKVHGFEVTYLDVDADGYFKFLKNAFRQKRKNLRNNLNGLYDLDIVLQVLNKYGLDLSVRAESLSEEILVDIYKSVTR